MFALSGVNFEEVLEQGDSILVRVIPSSSYRGFELSGLYCIYTPARTHARALAQIAKTLMIWPRAKTLALVEIITQLVPY